MRAVDPIDRIALMEKLGIGKECTVCEQNSDPYCMWKPDVVDVCEAICTAPTIEPERKKGKWIPVTKIYKVTEGRFPNTHIEWVDATEPDEIDAVRCSECREVFDFQDARNWCTECGADMREDGETNADVES